MNRKGDIFTIATILIILFLAASLILVFSHFSLTFFNKLFESGIFDGNEAGKTEVSYFRSSIIPLGNTTMIFLLLFCIIGLVIVSTRVQFSTGAIFAFFILLLVIVLISTQLVNVYQAIAHDPAFASTGNREVVSDIIFSSYTPLILFLLGILLLIIMYNKSGASQSVGI